MLVVNDSVNLNWREHLSYYKKDFFEWKPVGTYVHIKNNKLIHLELSVGNGKNPQQIEKLARRQYKNKDKIIIEGVYDNEDADVVCTADFVFTEADEIFTVKLSFKNKRRYAEDTNGMDKVANGLDYMAEKAKYARECGADNPFQDGFMMDKWV